MKYLVLESPKTYQVIPKVGFLKSKKYITKSTIARKRRNFKNPK